ncbi:MAG: hypothetical protein LC633_06290 [Desulfobulbaceae bacterium]|nr:hypothetical protein [Desulfobulbaceae bacterium]
MMKIAPGKIGFDFDCVVADTMEAFIRLASEDYGLEISPEEITDFMVAKCLAIDLEIIDEIFARLVRDPLGEGLKPMIDAIAVLEELAAEAPLTFITARPDLRPVAAWLERHLGTTSFARLRLVATGDHDNKGPHIKALGLTHFVDDRAGTCRALAGEEGITPIVYQQPWNFGKHDLNSVVNWEDIKKICG